MDLNTVYELEKSMWDAAKNRNREGFLQIVSEDAVMVCGGFRCSGKEYADIISVFDCKSYSMEHFEIVNQDEKSVQVHYVILVEFCNEENKDLAGAFHVTTTWKCINESWKVVFNMDQRVPAPGK